MYFIISLILFLASVILYHNSGDFDQFWKLLIASGLFGLCDSVNSLSLKSLLYTYKSMYGDKTEEKKIDLNEK